MVFSLYSRLHTNAKTLSASRIDSLLPEIERVNPMKRLALGKTRGGFWKGAFYPTYNFCQSFWGRSFWKRALYPPYNFCNSSCKAR